jgi:hypothetical protein
MSEPNRTELAESERQPQVELDAESRAILARCYRRFARRGRAILAERAA